MKTSLLFLVSIFLFTSLFSQSIINTRFFFPINKSIQGSIIGYNTHFSQVSQNKLTFISAIDTIEIIVNGQAADDYHLGYASNKVFNTPGIYELYVENTIDGIMHFQGYIRVHSQSNYSFLETDFSTFFGYRAIAGESKELAFHTWLQLDTLKQYSAFFVNTTSLDSISVDSLHTIGNFFMLAFTIPTDAAPGYYQLLIEGVPDTLLICSSALFIHNSNKVEIDSIAPDSMNNIPTDPTEIIIYGNHTHFTLDSNILFPIWFTEFDSVNVINDSVIKAYILFPPPMKAPTYVNMVFSLYNPTDGFMQYPIQFEIYSGVVELSHSFGSLKIFPNPTLDYLWLESDEFVNDQIKISVFNVSGAKVGEYSFNNQKRILLQTMNLAKGVYFVNIQGKMKQKVIKFIKN